MLSTAFRCKMDVMVSSIKQNLSTPNFPLTYPNDLDCQWRFIANENQSVKLEFNNFFIRNDVVSVSIV